MFWTAPCRLILASASAARRQVLASAGLAFEVMPAAIDERALERGVRAGGGTPADGAAALARAKAAQIAAGQPDALVLGCDQVLEIEGATLSKPRNRDEALAQLLALRGRAHLLHSAMALEGALGQPWLHVETVTLKMRGFTDDFAETYLDAAGGAALTSLGAYQYEGLGAHLFDAADGSHTAIMGLPLLALLARLRAIKALMS